MDPSIFIRRSMVETLIGRLPRLGADCSSRDFDADLFSLLDTRKVRKAMRTRSDVMERDERLQQDPDFLVFDDMPFEDWASETPFMEVDCEGENGKIEFAVGPYGYTARDGNFVERPRLDPIPGYTWNMDDAVQFKHRVFLSYLRLSIAEVEGQWGSDYRVALLLPSGETVHDYLADTLPHAIIGAVLGAMLRWTYPMASYKIID